MEGAGGLALKSQRDTLRETAVYGVGKGAWVDWDRGGRVGDDNEMIMGIR